MILIYKSNWQPKYSFWLSIAVLLLGMAIILLPLFVVFVTSLAPPMTAMGILHPAVWSWTNYLEAWNQGKFLRAFANSTYVGYVLLSPRLRH